MKKTMPPFAVLLLACVFLLAGCAEKPAAGESFAMDTIIAQTVYGDEEVIAKNNNSIRLIEEKMSKTLPGSDIYMLNHAGGQQMQVSEATYTVLRACMEAAEATGGAYDPTVGGVVSLWGFGTGYEKVPGERMMESVLGQAGYANVTLGENYMVGIGNTQLDLGGAVKGYTLDVLRGNLRTAGVESALVTMGSSIYACGVKPDGTAWTIGVRDPFQDVSQYVCTITLDYECVSTSGVYERGFTWEGAYYHHLIDPRTGWPAENGLVSVSVVGDDGMETDIYSTALFVMGLEEGLAFAGREGLDAIFITEDRGIYLTDGFGHDFELKDDTFHVQTQ